MDRAAQALFRPMRLRILEELRTAETAAGVARKLRMPRQKVSYHLRQLEHDGLVELVEERRKGNCVERWVRATARSYLVGAAALESLGTGDPEVARDRFSSAYLLATVGRTARELAELRAGAERAGKRLATFALTADVEFATPQARADFFEELTNQLARLVSRYHDQRTPGGRAVRLVIGAYPTRAQRSSRDDSTHDPKENP